MKIVKILLIFSIIFISVYLIDKSTSQSSNDAANIVVGVSNVGSESCLQCQKGGESFDRGCKMCEQDNINFRIKNTSNTPFISSWSNDNGLFYGDNKCSGEKIIPSIQAQINKNYWIQIKYQDSRYTISIFDDEGFQNKIADVTNDMCSIPTELKFLRFSMNDGKSLTDGGRISGQIDNIEIFDYHSAKIDLTNSENSLQKIYDEDFSKCKTKNCDNWVLQNDDVFFIDTEKEQFHFNSYVSRNNDYAHFELPKQLSQKEWMIRLSLSINDIEEFPYGEGILGIDSKSRNLIFVLTSVIMTVIGTYFSIKEKSFTTSILIIIFSSLLLYTSLTPLITNDFVYESKIIEKIVIIFGLSVISLILMSFSAYRIYLRIIKNSIGD